MLFKIKYGKMTSGEIINTYISATCDDGEKNGDEVCVDKGGACGIHCSKYTTSYNIVFIEYRDEFVVQMISKKLMYATL